MPLDFSEETKKKSSVNGHVKKTIQTLNSGMECALSYEDVLLSKKLPVKYLMDNVIADHLSWIFPTMYSSC